MPRIAHYSHQNDELLREGIEILRDSPTNKFIYRVTVVCMVLGGLSLDDAASCCVERKSTIAGWVREAHKEGFAALLHKRRNGRPSKITEEQLKELAAVLAENPRQYCYKSWGGPSLADYIQRTYNCSLGIRQCQRICQKLRANGEGRRRKP